MNDEIIIRPIPYVQTSGISSFVSYLLDNDFDGLYKPKTIEAYKKILTDSYFRKIYRGKHICLGAYTHEQLIGICIVKKEFEGVGFIEWIGVKKEFRKQ